MPKHPVSPVVQRHRAAKEVSFLKSIAVWCTVAIGWVALVTAVAHATETGRGPHYVGAILALLIVAPFGVSGFWLMKHESHPTIAVALLTMVGATALTTMVRMLGPSMAANALEVAFGSMLIIASGIGVLAALHQLGESARHSLRFLIVEAAAIILVIWTENVAPALFAGVACWALWKTAPTPPRPYTVYRREHR